MNPPPAPAESTPPTGLKLRDAFGLVALTILIVGVVAGAWHLGAPRTGVRLEKSGRQLAPFTLTERNGTTVSHHQLSNLWLVVNFVFTSCSVSCLEVNQRLADVQRLTADRPDVRLLSLSLDPRTDTPAVLSTFAQRFGAHSNRWLFLTGPKPAVYALLESSFLSRNPNDPANLTPGGFVGMEQIALVDPQGRVRAFVDGRLPDAPSQILRLLRTLR